MGRGGEGGEAEGDGKKMRRADGNDLHEPRPRCALVLDAAGDMERAFDAAEALAARELMAARRWRAASMRTAAPAAETLSELTPPAMGMRRR